MKKQTNDGASCIVFRGARSCLEKMVDVVLQEQNFSIARGVGSVRVEVELRACNTIGSSLICS